MRERDRHAADAAADVEYAALRLQAAHANEMAKKLGAHSLEIAIADKDAVRVRARQEAVAQHGIRQPADMIFVEGEVTLGASLLQCDYLVQAALLFDFSATKSVTVSSAASST